MEYLSFLSILPPYKSFVAVQTVQWLFCCLWKAVIFSLARRESGRRGLRINYGWAG
ncbi:hypothetical protein BDV10DRAFT_174049 [Aspergillus recurvatus]